MERQPIYQSSKIGVFLIGLFLSPLALFGQQELVNYDYYYQDHIKTSKIDFIAGDARKFIDNIYELLFSIKYNDANFQLSLNTPLLDLSRINQQRLVFTFDDISGGVRSYYYYIEHCNADWTPSILLPEEYITGRQEDRIDEYAFSAYSRQNYTHYLFMIPNGFMSITRSGNYLLHVIDGETDEPILTRRFVVYEGEAEVEMRMLNSVHGGQNTTHHNLLLGISSAQLGDYYNFNDVKVTVVQNRVWKNSITRSPVFESEEMMTFDPNNAFLFPAGDQFRKADVSSVKGRSLDVESFEILNDTCMAYIKADRIKERRRIHELDFNGNFLIVNNDNQRGESLEGQYIKTEFALESDKLLPEDIYIVGDFNFWQCTEANKMKYYPENKMYIGYQYLKQGIYNYAYATPRTDRLQFDHLQRNEFDTSNEYMVLVYYRGVSDRYDRLMSALVRQSNVFRFRR